MWIMTSDGWRQLVPWMYHKPLLCRSELKTADCNPLDGRYYGTLPSARTVAYIRWLEQEIVDQRRGRQQFDTYRGGKRSRGCLDQRRKTGASGKRLLYPSSKR